MNNACPTCGAVYAVAAKDIGRKIKCKKCNTALRVDDTGLVVDAPPPAQSKPGSAVAAAVVEDDDMAPVSKGRRDEDDEEPPRKKRAARVYDPNAPSFLKTIGGVPTIIFCLGLFLSIWFTFQSGPIAEAAVARAAMAPARLKMEMASDLKGAKGDAEKMGKIMESYSKKGEEASKEATETVIDTVRGVKWDRYGQLLGFVILAFGCIAYLRTEQLPVMHYAAGVILAGMMLALFSQASGCSGHGGDLMNLGGKLGGGLGGGKGGGFDFP